MASDSVSLPPPKTSVYSWRYGRNAIPQDERSTPLPLNGVSIHASPQRGHSFGAIIGRFTVAPDTSLTLPWKPALAFVVPIYRYPFTIASRTPALVVCRNHLFAEPIALIQDGSLTEVDLARIRRILEPHR